MSSKDEIDQAESKLHARCRLYQSMKDPNEYITSRNDHITCCGYDFKSRCNLEKHERTTRHLTRYPKLIWPKNFESGEHEKLRSTISRVRTSTKRVNLSPIQL